MIENFAENFANDLTTILLDKAYKGRICKTDLVHELRQNQLFCHITLKKRYHITKWQETEMLNLCERLGFKVTQTFSKKGRPGPIIVSFKQS